MQIQFIFRTIQRDIIETQNPNGTTFSISKSHIKSHDSHHFLADLEVNEIKVLIRRFFCLQSPHITRFLPATKFSTSQTNTIPLQLHLILPRRRASHTLSSINSLLQTNMETPKLLRIFQNSFKVDARIPRVLNKSNPTTLQSSLSLGVSHQPRLFLATTQIHPELS